MLERSETHLLIHNKAMGFAKAQAIPQELSTQPFAID
jgi:hypothetical protein